MEIITRAVSVFTNKVGFPSEVMPLAMLRPISGSATLAVATDIMKTYGVDSKIGLITSTIMGSTETTFYTIAIYTGSIGVKKIRFVLVAALIADSKKICNYIYCNFFIFLISFIHFWK